MNDRLIDLSTLSLGRAGAGEDTRRECRVPMPRARWRTRVLLPALVLSATASLFAFSSRGALLSATRVKVVPVLAKPGTQSTQAGEVIVQAPGWVEADPFSTAVSALTDGVVAEVLVLEGEHVEQGQVVARLVQDDARLALQQDEAQLAERRAAAKVAAAMLEEAQRNWEHPIELTRALQTAEARLAEAQAQLARWPSDLAREEAIGVQVEAEYMRLLPLHENQQASEIEFIKAKQAHLAQQANVESIRRQRAVLQSQVRALEAEATAARRNLDLRIADARALAAAAATAKQAEAAVEVALAQRDEAALRLERTEVKSPIAGVVMTRLAEPGSKLMLGMDDPRSSQVVRLYDPKRLQVRVDVPLADAAAIGLGQPAEVVVDVLPDRVFQGRVSRIVHEADVQKNTLQFKVAIEAPADEIKPEMLARARFLAVADNEASGADAVATLLLIPESAVVRENDTTSVWLADPVEETAQRRVVRLGRATTQDNVAVLDGLQPGDRVIINPPSGLEDGASIIAEEQ